MKTNLPNLFPQRLALTLCAVALCLAPQSWAAGQIGFNFKGGASDTLGTAESAGAPGYEQANWNNGGAAERGTAVVDKDGAATGITVSSSANNTWGNGAGTSTPDRKLVSTYLDSGGSFANNSSPYQFNNNANRPEVYVTGLKAWLMAQGAVAYDVVVYFDGDSNAGRIGEYWLQAATGVDSSGLPNALGPDLTPHLFGIDNANFGDTQTYAEVPASANTAANAAAGNYVVLTGADGDNFILRTDEHARAGADDNMRSVINAFQIVPRFALATPVIGAGPASQIKFVGGTATLSVAAYGPGLHYQWARVGSGDLANATNLSLTISNLTAADDASQYYVTVSNGAGSVQSDSATLTVQSVPHDGGFVSVVLSNNPVAYWRLNDSAGPISDYIGNRNGMAGATTLNAGDYALNANGSFIGFEADNTGWLFINSYFDSSVTLPPLNLSTNTATFVAWVYPAAVSGRQKNWTGILVERSGNCGLTYTDTGGELGYVWNGYYSFHSGLIVPEGRWSMVAMVVEPTQVTLYLVNPVTGLTSAASVRTTAVADWGGPASIGVDPQFPNSRGFDGVIDEVAVFKRSLSSGEVLGLYAAGRAAGTLPPVIGQQPASETVYAGRVAKLTVGASGAGTLTYQWYKNGSPVVNAPGISGAQTATLTISNMAAGYIGSYTVTVSNPAGNVTSDPAVLDVITPTGQPYEAAVLAANPYAYWRFSESSGTSAFDNVGGFTGTYGGAQGLGLAGPQPAAFPGFETTNTAIQTMQNVAGSYVAVPPLHLNTNTVTITAWVYSTGAQNGAAALVYCRGGGTSAGLDYNGTQLSYTWNDDWNWNSGLTIPDGQWVFVALVVEPTKGTVYMGADGALQFATKSATQPAQAFGTTTYIGGDVAFGDARIFNGLIDEVSVFNRALSSSEIIQLYSAGTGVGVAPQITLLTPGTVNGYPGVSATFQASAIGSGTLSYQWYRGATKLTDGGNLWGATTPTLTLTNAALGDAGDYTLVVTGSAGSTTSPVSRLNVGVPPSLPYHSTVLAAGPVAYWRLNETSGTVAHDAVGGHDGTYGAAMQLAVTGQETSGLFGFAADTAAPRFTRSTDQSWVTVPALNLNANTVTIMAWVYPTVRPDNWSGIFLVKSPSTAGLMFRDNSPNTLGMMWNNGAYWYSGTSLPIPVNQWSFVALSVAPTQATLYVMNSAGTNSWVNNNPMNAEPWSGPARIGSDDYSVDRTFNGSINEVAVFNRTLTGDELQQFYATAITPQAAAVALQIQSEGGSVKLTWGSGLLLEAPDLAGPWTTNTTATSPFTVTPDGPQKFYRVLAQ